MIEVEAIDVGDRPFGHDGTLLAARTLAADLMRIRRTPTVSPACTIESGGLLDGEVRVSGRDLSQAAPSAAIFCLRDG